MYQVNQENNSTSSKSLLLMAKGITHNFDYPLFKNIDLNLQKKESIAIIGASGSGKSTLLNILSSLLNPNKGEVYYNNKNIFALTNNQLLQLRKEEFGIIFQAHYLFRGFSGFDNLHISELLSDNKLDKELLKKLKIDHVLSQNIGSLSGGQQQRLSIARVLTKKPKVIFADEPTGNLDEKTAFEVIDILFEYIKLNDAGMLMVTHEQNIASRCDKIYRLKDYNLERVK